MATIIPVETISGYLRRGRASILAQVGKLLDHAIAVGEDAKITAKKAGQYFNGWYANRRNAEGAVIRATRAGLQRSWPAEAGQASQQARTILMHETSKANGLEAITIAQRTDGIGIKWDLSPGHPETDDCNGYAEGSSENLPAGVYLPNDVPPYPAHIRCLCILSIVDLP